MIFFTRNKLMFSHTFFRRSRPFYVLKRVFAKPDPLKSTVWHTVFLHVFIRFPPSKGAKPNLTSYPSVFLRIHVSVEKPVTFLDAVRTFASLQMLTALLLSKYPSDRGKRSDGVYKTKPDSSCRTSRFQFDGSVYHTSLFHDLYHPTLSDRDR